jgi:hypothetical protein
LQVQYVFLNKLMHTGVIGPPLTSIDENEQSQFQELETIIKRWNAIHKDR